MSLKPKPKIKKTKGKPESKQDYPSRGEASKVLDVGLSLIRKTFRVRLSDVEQNHFPIVQLSIYAKESESTKSHALEKVLAKIEERTEGGAVWKRIFITKGVKMAWIAARNYSSIFASAEKVLDGIMTKDVKMLFAGALGFFIPDSDEEIEGVHWLLQEIDVSK